MNKILTETVTIALAAGALAMALSGCCMFGSGGGSANGSVPSEADGTKKHGVNTSMTLGIGTDGIRFGSDSNVGSHGASVHAGADAGMDGMTIGADAGVH